MFYVQLIRSMAPNLPLQALWRDKRAVTSIEYVIIAIIIAVAIMGGLSKVGGLLSNDFNSVSSEL